MRSARPILTLAVAMCLSAALVPFSSVRAQGVDVVAHVTIQDSGAGLNRAPHSREGAVLWLTPADNSTPKLTSPVPAHFQLVQKDKQFHPHLLVIPAGSIVDFPNLDPFFHNVFSLFNGRKFDLGLYETGKSRSVHFDRPGVSFIFCNIHPEMSAVIVSVPTTYFASSTADGSLVVHDVAPGTYDVHLWAIGNGNSLPKGPTSRVTIEEKNTDLGTFSVHSSLMGAHKNKFGEDYDMQHADQY